MSDEPKYRPELPEPPAEVAALPVDRGYPVPWFVAWIDGRPDFRVVDPDKLRAAVNDGLCWICGGRLKQRVTFTIGPMCVVNLITSEPPSHPTCVNYAVRACPFMARPDMVRRDHNLPEGSVGPPGIHLARNPGVMCLYTTRPPGYSLMRVGDGGVLFKLWTPTTVTWWREGREATVDEVCKAVDLGLPALRELAESDGPEAIQLLCEMTVEAMPLFAKAKGGPRP